MVQGNGLFKINCIGFTLQLYFKSYATPMHRSIRNGTKKEEAGPILPLHVEQGLTYETNRRNIGWALLFKTTWTMSEVPGSSKSWLFFYFEHSSSFETGILSFIRISRMELGKIYPANDNETFDFKNNTTNNCSSLKPNNKWRASHAAKYQYWIHQKQKQHIQTSLRRL
jgi:hypothetical protein